jgi:hypothetical protein
LENQRGRPRKESHGLIGLHEDVILTGVHFVRNSRDDPISRAHDVTTFEGVDPAVIVHLACAMLALTGTWVVWSTVVSDYLAFTLDHRPTVGVGEEMISVFEPLARLDYYRTLTKLGHD